MLFTTITAIAPAFCPASTFSENVHNPLLTMAMFPAISALLSITSHASVVSVDPPPELSSSTRIRFAVIGASPSPGILLPKLAGGPV